MGTSPAQRMHGLVTAIRSFWRQTKINAASGGTFSFCLCVAFSGVVRRFKRKKWTKELADQALWLMYHPECRILPCDGWKATGLPVLGEGDVSVLRMRYAKDRNRVEHHLNVVGWTDLHRFKAETPTGQRIAIHLHVFYPQIAKRIVAAIAALPIRFDMFVSVPEGVNWTSTMVSCLRHALPNVKRLKVVCCPNRGRDIAPMICAFGVELSQYDVIAHIHTKRSPHLFENEWMDFLLESLFSGSVVDKVIYALSNGAGIVIPPDFEPMQEDPTGWMHNLDNANRLIKKCHLDLDLKRDFTPCIFPQGSMFWARGDYMKGFLGLPLTFDDFEAEPIGADGSLAHVLERLICILGVKTGMSVLRLDRNDEANVSP